MKRVILSVAGIVLTLIIGNILLASYLLNLLGKEGAERLAILRQDQENEIIAEVRGRVETACLMIKHIAKTAPNIEEAQKTAMEAASDIRFGQNNYVWIHRLDPNDVRSAFMLVHPADELRGRDNGGLIDLERITKIYQDGKIVEKTDPSVKYVKPIDLFTAINRLALSQGEGIVSYYWPKIIDGKCSTEGYRKVAFIKYIPQWHWVVGAGAYADHIDLAVKQRAKQFEQRNRALLWKVGSRVLLFSMLIAACVAALGGSALGWQIRELRKEISERGKIEENLRRVSMLQEAILDNAGFAIVAVSPQGIITSYNPAAERMFGYPAEEIIGKTGPELFHDAEEVRAWARKMPPEWNVNEKPVFSILVENVLRGVSGENEWTFIRKDGSRFPVLLSVTVMRDHHGNVDGFLGLAADITMQKRAEEALRESEQRFRAFLDASYDGLVLVDSEGRIAEWNPAMTRLMGVSHEAAVGSSLLETLTPYIDLAPGSQITPEKMKQMLTRALSSGKAPFLGVLQEYRLRRADDTTVDVQQLSFPIQTAHGFNLGTICRDVTDNKRAEEQLRQALKMESVGRLAAGVAHDFNNLLSPILGYSEMLLEEVPGDSESHESLAQIKTAAERARDLTRQLLSFGRKQVLCLAPVDVNDTIREISKLLRRTLRENIELQAILSAVPRVVMADKGQLEQLLMNLALNAQDAMPQGGKLCIETGAMECTEAGTADMEDMPPGRYALLTIKDNGCGMNEETKSRIFEPFFSTKGNFGTGLGLATVYGIVKQHGGHIGVESQIGYGTTFRIYLPMTDRQLAEPAKLEPAPSGHRGTETILVVEDNDMVGRMAVNVLEQRGYAVLLASNGPAALRILRKQNTPIDLLLTDVVMPGMNGKELYQEASRCCPGLKVLFMSGYAEDVIAHHGMLDPGINFIGKPFSAEGLTRKVYEVLRAV